ncbi:MAG: reverse transcriptase domain-containing protein [Shewanella psychromarinicola]|uniref:reverse transcriptase domain-containing protein n=1 Tax=Shewanella psychromarinicola TaxID=2487742 RepID=UPI0030020B0B
MKIKKINNDFFKNAILKGNSVLLDEFTEKVTERKVGGDTFFEIEKNSYHHSINERITKLVLSNIEINSSACGFVQGKSYYDFLRPHVSGYYFLRLDIKKFFHSIAFEHILKLFKSIFSEKKEGLKFSPLEVAVMSVTHKCSKTCPDEDIKDKCILPMGYSSSPVISNILFRKIDILIQKYCEDKKIIYSRYADDLLFSSLNSNFIHCSQFEREISIFISSLSLKLKKSKRKASQNTISLNGYVIQNTKKRKPGFFNVYEEDPVGKIRLSNKKIKVIKKLSFSLRNKRTAVFIMERLFKLNYSRFKVAYADDVVFYEKYAKDQLQNKLKGYRSYLISLMLFNEKHGCVDIKCLETVKELVDELELHII